MESLLPEFDLTGFVRERSGASLPGIVPSNTYTTRDGKYVVIGANGDSIFNVFASGPIRTVTGRAARATSSPARASS